jgi:DNA-binding CsgD family transcriptional regulator
MSNVPAAVSGAGQGPAGGGVLGRADQLAAVDRFLDAPRSRGLVLEGEAGIGKTTLWLAGVDAARRRGYEVLRATPLPVEASLSLAALGDLLEGVRTATRERLPGVQRHALARALGEEESASRVHVRLLAAAVLALLRALGAERRVLVAVDDLQWLDRASGSVLVYALRRLGDADVRLLATCRGDPGAPLPFDLERAVGGEELVRVALGPLSEGAIRRMLRLRLDLDLPRPHLHAVHETTNGNPFYALELARAGVRTDASGGIRLPHDLEELVATRLWTLPAKTRDALAVVASIADRRLELLTRAGAAEALEPALAAGVLHLHGDRVRFAHPLIAAAALQEAGEERLRQVHRLLAEIVDEPEQRVRHLAAAATEPDADLARLLADAAEAARGRGAPAAAAQLLERALELAPPGEDALPARLMAAAAAAHAEAGHTERVGELVAEAQRRLPPGPARAEILVTAAETRPGLVDLFRQAAAEAGDTAVGVRARLGLVMQELLAGAWADAVEHAQEAAGLARRLDARPLLGTALTYVGGTKLMDSRPDGIRELEEALELEREVGTLPMTPHESPRAWMGAALLLRDDPDAARRVYEERLARGRERGDELSVFQSMQLLLVVELRAGELAAARARAAEALDELEALDYPYGRPILLSVLASVDAHLGELERARELATEAVAVLESAGDRLWATHARASLLFTELCAGDAGAAVAQADAIASRFPDGRECWWSYHQADELAALALAGEDERALARVEALRRAGEELELPRFLAWAERGLGLVRAARGDLPAAQAALEAALAHHERFRLPLERARTLLAYGHVLRRAKRRRQAHAALAEAIAAFERAGACHLARSAEDELRHLGGRPSAGGHELTTAEAQIAELVAAGLSNKEVAARLYVAVSTVEAALTRIYGKLGLRSRSQLARALADRRTPPAG